MPARESRIIAVDHVNLEAPPGLREQLTFIYAELGQLDPLPWTPQDDTTGLRFGSEGIELWIREREVPRIEAIKPRIRIAVDKLADVEAALEERHIEFDRVSGIGITDRRLSLLDPAGNRLEFKQAWFHPLV